MNSPVTGKISIIQLSSSFIWCLVVLLFCSFLPAQTLNFENISIERGLSHSEVTSIEQDHHGFLWFGTSDGLDKYDGIRFVIYKPDPKNPASISHTHITTIYKDRQEQLWIGTQDGLNLYDYRTDSFSHYRPFPADSAFSQFNITVIYEDRKGSFWVGATNSGLYRFDRNEKKFYKHSISETIHNHELDILALYEDSNGTLWLGSGGQGVFCYVNERDTFEPFFIKPSSVGKKLLTINKFYESTDSLFYLGASEGLYQLNRITGQAEPYLSSFLCDSYGPCKNITGILQDQKNVMWISSNGGGLIAVYGSKIINNYRKNPLAVNSLKSDQIQTIFIDEGNILWAGTTGAGIAKLYIDQKKFSLFQNDPINPNSLSDNLVRAIFVDTDGIVWLGTENGGLDKFNRRTGKFTHYTHDPGNPYSISDNKIVKIVQDKSGQIWIGTDKGGLNRFDQNSERFFVYKNNPANPLSISDNTVWEIFQDAKGTLWIGTGGGGLNKFDRETGAFTCYKYDPDNNNSLSNNYIWTICEPTPGTLWIGTNGGGISKFNIETEHFINYENKSDDPTSLSSNFIYSIYKDLEGTIWVGTLGGGLCRYNPLNDTFTQFRGQNILPNEVINGIEEDSNGNLWLSTNKGITRFNPRTLLAKNYIPRDGLQSNEFNNGAHYKAPNGEMFFGGIYGFNSFFPDSIKNNLHIPPVIITDYQVYDPNPPSGNIPNRPPARYISIAGQDTLVLSSKENSIRLRYVALDFAAPENNQYAYQLSGIDKDWNYVGNRRFATYTKLPSGTYKFRVIAANNDEQWNETGATLTIIIKSPYWSKAWFIALCVVLSLALIYYIYFTTTLKIKQRNKRLVEINENLNKEIQERQKAEMELRERKEFLDTILNNIEEGIGIVDPKENIIFCNNAFARILEVQPDKLVGSNLLEIFPQEEQALILDETQKRKMGEKSTYQLYYYTPGGEKKYLRVNITPWFNDKKELIGAIGAIMDISNQVKAEENKAMMEAQLRQAQKLETIGTLAGGIAHDFNNILVPIIGYTEMSLELLTDNKQVRANLEKILKSSKRAKELIKQILTFSRQDKVGLEPIEIHPLVKEALKLLRSSLPTTIDIRQHIDENCGTILADPTQIHQVLMNLCTNAYHAMRDSGGVLDVRLGLVAADQELVEKDHYFQLGRNYIMLVIKDTGQGMDKATQERIFEPFFTTKKVGEGTGLGLSAVHGIVISHNGKIYIESQPGKGSAFTIYFPQANDKKIKEKKGDDPMPKGHEHILFVDDEKDIVSLYKQILENLGYVVTAKTNSVESLEEFRKNPGIYNLVITDQTMPNLTGADLSKEILRIRPDMPIILCTGYSESITQEKALALGIREFILKPLTMTTIASAIRRSLDSQMN
ncbi:MAG TPA: two-component regulator propeller domain-containing protein [bacterium]|nr:two-component regulator propeller domain-containing protein [bacterium]HPN46147.1 two-component regulator propeller domain-containing protein [bacterium]